MHPSLGSNGEQDSILIDKKPGLIENDLIDTTISDFVIPYESDVTDFSTLDPGTARSRLSKFFPRPIQPIIEGSLVY